MDKTIERQIKDIENLINFYERLGETNNLIENYKKQLLVQLDDLKNPKESSYYEKQDKSQV
ncbi:MAG: hypothetical protein ACK55I_48795 [bacterium]